MSDTSNATTSARFLCSACGEEAGTIELVGTPARAEVRRRSFTSALTSAVPARAFAPLRKAIEAGRARALHALDAEYTPFFCPRCDACYCGSHWVRWDVFDDDDPHWHDSIRGRCPQGHERMLED